MQIQDLELVCAFECIHFLLLEKKNDMHATFRWQVYSNYIDHFTQLGCCNCPNRLLLNPTRLFLLFDIISKESWNCPNRWLKTYPHLVFLSRAVVKYLILTKAAKSFSLQYLESSNSEEIFACKYITLASCLDIVYLTYTFQVLGNTPIVSNVWNIFLIHAGWLQCVGSLQFCAGYFSGFISF